MCTIQAQTPLGIIKCTFTTKLPNDKEEALKVAQDPYFPCNTYIALKAVGTTICVANDEKEFTKNNKRRMGPKRKLQQKKYNCICNTYRKDSTPKTSRTTTPYSIATTSLSDSITSADTKEKNSPVKSNLDSSPSKIYIAFSNIDFPPEFKRFDIKTVKTVYEKFEDLRRRRTAKTQKLLNLKSVTAETPVLNRTSSQYETELSPEKEKTEKVCVKYQLDSIDEEENSSGGSEKLCDTTAAAIKKNIVMAINSENNSEGQHETMINSIKQTSENYLSLEMILGSQERIINEPCNVKNEFRQISIQLRKDDEYEGRRVILQSNIQEEYAANNISTEYCRINAMQITVTAFQKQLKLIHDLKRKQLVAKSNDNKNKTNSQSSETTMKNSFLETANKNSMDNAEERPNPFEYNLEYKYPLNSESLTDSIANALMNLLSVQTVLISQSNNLDYFTLSPESVPGTACGFCEPSYPIIYNARPGLLAFIPVISHEVVIGNPNPKVNKKKPNSFTHKGHSFPLDEPGKVKTEEYERIRRPVSSVPHKESQTRTVISALGGRSLNAERIPETTNSAEVSKVDINRMLGSTDLQNKTSRKKNKRKGRK